METFIAKTFFGLEELLADELRLLGASDIKILKRAVQFDGDVALLYKANLQLRTALRILMPLVDGPVTSAKELYLMAKKVNWTKYFTPEQTFAVDSVVSSNPAFNHSNFVSLTVKDAIADQFTDLKGQRPSVHKEAPDVLVSVHISKEACTISIDTSGESLHRRGYRQTKHEAPLNELLAAAILTMSGWKPGDLLIDPMCGSGTIAIEAALYGMGIPVNYLRTKFGFMNWRNFDAELWNTVKEDAMAEAKRDVSEPFVFASDIENPHVKEAINNARKAGVSSAIKFQVADFFELPAVESTKNKFLVFNPPYNERLELEDVQSFYKAVSDCLKRQYQGYTACLLSGSSAAAKAVRLSTSKTWQLFNGSLPCQLLKYELYEGSRRK